MTTKAALIKAREDLDCPPDENEPNYPDMSIEICEDCYGDCDPIDDMFYCPACRGRGWVYAQMFESPYHSHWDIEQWNREEEAKHGKPVIAASGETNETNS